MSQKKAKTVQIRVTSEGKTAMDLLQDEIYKERGIHMSMGEILLEVLSQWRPELVQRAVRKVERETEGDGE